MLRFLAMIFDFLPAQAFSQINIIPFATSEAKVSDTYNRQLLRHLRRIVNESANAGCQDLGITLYVPQPIPTSYSSKGIVTFNSERIKLTNYVDDNGGNVLLVSALSACGKYQNFPDVAGCANPGGVATVEATGDPKNDAIALLHEIGHSLQLAWASPSSDKRRIYEDKNKNIITDISHLDDPKRLMHYRITGNTKMSSHDCSSFLASNALFDRDISSAVIEPETANYIQGSEEADEAVTFSLETLLSQKWFHDEPPLSDLREAIESEGLDDVRMYVVTNSRPHLWRNSLLTLGYFGDSSDADLLRNFLRRSVPVPEGNERLVSDAKSAASEAIGILIGRSMSVEAASAVFDIMNEADQQAANFSASAPGLLPLEEINLEGLSNNEQSFARELVLRNIALAQEIAVDALDEEALAALSDQNSYVAAITSETSQSTIPSDGVSFRNNSLSRMGFSPDFIEGLSSFRQQLSE